MKQGKVFGHNVFYVVGHIHLVAEKLNFISLNIYVIFNFREIKNTGQVERIIHIEVNMEKRLVAHGEKFVIELIVIFVLQIGWFAYPCRIYIVDNVVFIRFYLFAVFPFFLLSECNFNWQEFTVFCQQFLNFAFFEVIQVVIVDVHYNICTAIGLDGLFECIFGVAVAGPVLACSSFAERLGENFHFFGNHKRGIEAKSEMSDNVLSIIFVFFQKFLSTRKCNLIDVFVNFFGSHPNAAIRYGQFFLLWINAYPDGQISKFAFELAHGCQCFKFLGSIHSVRNDFTQKNLVIGI